MRRHYTTMVENFGVNTNLGDTPTEDDLKDKAEWAGKRQKGLAPFNKKNAGDPEKGIAGFNHAMGTDAGGACCESLLDEDDEMSREDAEEVEALAKAAKSDPRLRNSNLFHAEVEATKQDNMQERFRKPKNKFKGELTEDVDFDDFQYEVTIVVPIEITPDRDIVGGGTFGGMDYDYKEYRDEINDGKQNAVDTFMDRVIDLFTKDAMFGTEETEEGSDMISFDLNIREADEIDDENWNLYFSFESTGEVQDTDLRAEMAYVLGKVGNPSYSMEYSAVGTKRDVDDWDEEYLESNITIYPSIGGIEIQHEDIESAEDDEISDSFKEI